MARRFNATRLGRLRPGYSGRTLHLIGDLHFGAVAALPARTSKVMADIKGAMKVAPAAHIQIGDQTNSALTGEVTAAKAWLAQLPQPWHIIAGNHDLFSSVTIEQWEADYSAQRRKVVDFGFALGLFISPESLVGGGDTTTVVYSQATLDWLDAQLAAASKDCLIFAHAPLANTVIGPTTGPGAVWGSDDPPFYAHDDAAIRAVLAARSRAKAWISGHTHSPITAPGFIKTENVGGRSVLALNCSAVYYTGRTYDLDDPLRTVLLTHTGSDFEIRVRDHGAGAWVGPTATSRVTTVPIPA